MGDELCWLNKPYPKVMEGTWVCVEWVYMCGESFSLILQAVTFPFTLKHSLFFPFPSLPPTFSKALIFLKELSLQSLYINGLYCSM